MRAKLGDEKESPVEADDDSKDNSDDIAATIELIEQTPKQKAAGLLSYCLGCVFGRWDIRMALDKSLIAKLPAPFDPLPVCPPGMLVGPDGYPATSSRIVSEEWLKYRPNSGTIPDCAGVNSVTIDDRDYPLQIEWDGLLVDDSATDDKIPHAKDIVQRVHQVLSFLFGQRVEEIERELCETLAVRTLRDYFRRPSGFFEWHLDQYSKSHRKAPIYWPLSTESGSFTIWVYYHRLDDQTFYTAINLATVRIEDAEHHLATLQDKLKDVSGRNASDLREQLEAVQNYRDELVEFRNEVLRAAELPYRPNLNDGVLINAAPLHKTFRLRRWRGDLENCWAKLKNGDLDWAHLAYTIWPDQVRTKCRNDRSLAIAHGLEDICEVPSSEEKKTRKRSKSKP
jgi:peptidoglycan/xylan/chitin deacetylase (PgdA/CDA1 family)